MLYVFRGSQASWPPRLRGGGCWKRWSGGEATHLPLLCRL